MATHLPVFLMLCLVISGIAASETDIVYDDDAEDSPLSQTCMQCLCKVMGCVKDEGCVGNTCGVMHITQGYWEMAHYKESDPDNLEAFQTCSNNVWCATRTVQRYMRQYLPACEEKRPDRFRCENALALHKFGIQRCHRNLTESAQDKLHSCLDEKVWKWLEDAEE